MRMRARGASAAMRRTASIALPAVSARSPAARAAAAAWAAVAEPYPTLSFQSLHSLPGVRMDDRGNGTYVFDIEIRQTDREALDMLASLLEPDAGVTVSDEEARSLGILPPIAH